MVSLQLCEQYIYVCAVLGGSRSKRSSYTSIRIDNDLTLTFAKMKFVGMTVLVTAMASLSGMFAFAFSVVASEN